VDVIVLDIKSTRETPNIEHVRDVEELERVVASDVPDDVSLRLFLVEDVSAPVVEILGAAGGCYPHFFENHMHTIGHRTLTKIDSGGLATLESDIDSSGLSTRESNIDGLSHEGYVQSTSDTREQPYFSVGFRRLIKLEKHSEIDIELFQKPRTMYRDLKEDPGVLEERISGVMNSTESGRAKTGKQP
jgi:hypothetical protein